jgi:hypothetical protein
VLKSVSISEFSLHSAFTSAFTLQHSALLGRALVVRFAVPPVSSSGPTSTSSLRSTIVVIPARYDSSRLPGKALADIGGEPMIQHVYRRASQARHVNAVIVATDDARIVDAVRAFGGDVRMTAASHRSGTDRLAEVAATIDCEIVVNLQEMSRSSSPR